MKICGFFILLFLFANSCISQSKPNFNKIKKFANTEKYQELLFRFVNNDSLLSFEDYNFLYYGQAFQLNYQPYFKHPKEDELFYYLSKSSDSVDYNFVLKYTQEFLFNNQLYLKYILLSAIIYEAMLNDSLAAIWYKKYANLLNVIIKSGDGRTIETAYIVTKVADEYTVIQYSGLKYKTQYLIKNKNGKYYDIIEAFDSSNKIVKVYFDVNLFFCEK